jgi:transcriptional regulator of aromatic amino acid metabolism
VEILHRYSNLSPSPQATQLAAVAKTDAPAQEPARSPGHIHRAVQRLDSAVIEQLLQDYRDGLSTRQLATKYQLGKSTILRLLRRYGVLVRPRGWSV